MGRFQISLSAFVLSVSLIAVICGIVRWGLGLPNMMANQLIQSIVIGNAPIVTLLGLGTILSIRDRARLGRFRPFWLGFLACGSLAVLAYAAHALLIRNPNEHYSVRCEVMLNDLLMRCGMTWDPTNPAGHEGRYAIVLTGLVVLLSLPQVLVATLGGWLMERREWARRLAVNSDKNGPVPA